MQITLLGTGAAEGYPALFCNCQNCTEARALGGHSLRKRCAALINDDLLIDLGPDLIASCQAHGVNLTNVQYALQTHEHSDHLDPTNLIWRYPGFTGSELPVLHWYASAGAFARARGQFQAREQRDAEMEKAKVSLHTIEPGQQFEVGRYTVRSVLATHGGEHETVMLYVIGDGARTIFYCTDTGLLPEESWETLRADGRKVDLLLMDETVGISKASSVHLNTDQFLQQVARMRSEGILAENARVFAHHFSHHHNPVYPKLVEYFKPFGVEVTYDGLVIEV